jgi:N-methylhydantoinase B
MEIATVPHGVDVVYQHTASAAHHAVPLTALFGGYPGSGNRFLMLRDTDVLEQFATGVIPAPGQLAAGSEEELEPKAFGVEQRASDVYLVSWCGAGGYGDPLDRDPGSVRADVSSGAVSQGEAERLYGVVIRDGVCDESATATRRKQLRGERRGWSAPKAVRTADPDGPARTLGPGLSIRQSEGQAVFACADCGAVLARSAPTGRTGRSRTSLQYSRPTRCAPTPIASPTRTLSCGSSPAPAASV